MDPEAPISPLTDWAYLKPRLSIVPRRILIDLAVRLAYPIAGDIVEFGVWEGQSTRDILESLRRCERDQPAGTGKRIFACDSFKGLSEKFENMEVGAFACDTPVIPGVEIVEGYFEQTLTPELAQRVGKVSFASLDADLYSSTLCALRWLTPLLSTGSLLLFDEFLGEHESEKRAFDDWSEETGTQTLAVAEFLRNPSGCGSRLDKRVLFQIVAGDQIQTRPNTLVR